MRTMRNRNMEGLLSKRGEALNYPGQNFPFYGGGPSGGGPNPYGSFHRKDRVDFGDALLTPEERKNVALQGHYTGNPDVAAIMKKDRDIEAANIKNQFVSSGKRADVPAEEEGMWDKIKNKVGEGVDWLSGATAEKEGAEAAYAPSHGMALDPHWQKKTAGQKEGWDTMMAANQGGKHAPVGTDPMDQMVAQSGVVPEGMPAPAAETIAGGLDAHMNPVEASKPAYNMMDDMVAQSGVEGLLSADDAEKKKKKKGLSKSEKAGYAKIGEMLMGSGSAPDMRPPAPPNLSIKQGQIAFPGLLAQQAPTQQRYTPRGLV